MELTVTAKATVVNKDGVLARISFNISDLLFINGCTLRQGQRGVFLSMPSWKSNDGKYHDYVYGNGKQAQAALLEHAKLAYDQALIEQSAPENAESGDLPF